MYRFLLFVVFEGEAANKPEKSGFFICFYLASVRPRVVLTRKDKVRLPLALSSLIKPKIFPKALPALRDQAYGRFGLAQTSGLFFVFT